VWPGNQYFELYDSYWNIIDFGLTTVAEIGPEQSVPEPSSTVLFAIGLIMLSLRRFYITL
jgi:hypothetical protein